MMTRKISLLFLAKSSLWLICLFVGSALGVTAPATTAATIDFNREVRPILSEHCYTCHGPDAQKRKAELRFDRKESALGKAESGESPIVPGSLEKSEMIRRITSTDRDEIMPPPKAHKALKPAQVETLKRWVQQGAEWSGHWSYRPFTGRRYSQSDRRFRSGPVACRGINSCAR